MAFQFKPYQSVYVDPKRVEIAGMLRERYLGNMQASDSVQTALDEMLVSNFEGDKKLAKELRDAVGSDLDGMSDRADYENLGLKVNKTAKNFNKGYRPIEQNYNQFQTQKQAVEKAYEDGSINSNTYNKWSTATQYGYTGLERDKEGNITNFYTARNPVKDVDILEKYADAIAKLVSPESTASDVMEIQYDQQFGIPVATVRTATSTETIPVSKIQEVIEGVNSDPTVAASISQQVFLETFMDDDIDPNTGETGHAASVRQYADNVDSEIDRLSMELTSTKQPAIRKQIQSAIDTYTQERDKLVGPQGVLGDAEQTKRVALNIAQSSYLKEFEEAAYQKAYVKEEFTQSYDINWGHYNDKVKAATDANSFETALVHAGTVEILQPESATPGEAQRLRTDAGNLRDSSIEKLSVISGLNISQEELAKFDRSQMEIQLINKIMNTAEEERTTQEKELLSNVNSREQEFIKNVAKSPRYQEAIGYINSFERANADYEMHDRKLSRIYKEGMEMFRADIADRTLNVTGFNNNISGTEIVNSFEEILSTQGVNLQDFLIAYDDENRTLEGKERSDTSAGYGDDGRGRQINRMERALSEATGRSSEEGKKLMARFKVEMLKKSEADQYEELVKSGLNDNQIATMFYTGKVNPEFERDLSIAEGPLSLKQTAPMKQVYWDTVMDDMNRMTGREFGLDILQPAYNDTIAGLRGKADKEGKKKQETAQLQGKAFVEVYNGYGQVDPVASRKVTKDIKNSVNRAIIGGDVPVFGTGGGAMYPQSSVAPATLRELLNPKTREDALSRIAGGEEYSEGIAQMFKGFDGDKIVTASVDESSSILYDMDIFSSTEEGVPLMAVPITFKQQGGQEVKRNFYLPTSVIKDSRLQNFLSGSVTQKHFNHVINKKNKLGTTSSSEPSFTQKFPIDNIFQNNGAAYNTYMNQAMQSGRGIPKNITYFTGAKKVNITNLTGSRNADGSDLVVDKVNARNSALVEYVYYNQGKPATRYELINDLSVLRQEMKDMENNVTGRK